MAATQEHPALPHQLAAMELVGDADMIEVHVREGDVVEGIHAPGPIVLSGDLYHFAVSRERRRVPPFNSDADQTTASMQRVESLLEETGATLWIEHELAHFERQKHAPEYYR